MVPSSSTPKPPATATRRSISPSASTISCSNASGSRRCARPTAILVALKDAYFARAIWEDRTGSISARRKSSGPAARAIDGKFACRIHHGRRGQGLRAERRAGVAGAGRTPAGRSARLLAGKTGHTMKTEIVSIKGRQVGIASAPDSRSRCASRRRRDGAGDCAGGRVARHARSHRSARRRRALRRLWRRDGDCQREWRIREGADGVEGDRPVRHRRRTRQARRHDEFRQARRHATVATSLAVLHAAAAAWRCRSGDTSRRVARFGCRCRRSRSSAAARTPAGAPTSGFHDHDARRRRAARGVQSPPPSIASPAS